MSDVFNHHPGGSSISSRSILDLSGMCMRISVPLLCLEEAWAGRGVVNIDDVHAMAFRASRCNFSFAGIVD